jgi:hypothetical protein
MIRAAMPLSDVLAHAEASIAKLLRGPANLRTTVAGTALAPSEIILGPYALEELPEGRRRYRLPITRWEAGYLDVSLRPNAVVGLAVEHHASDEDMGLSTSDLPEALRLLRAELAGFRVSINASGHRTRPSFCFAAFLACSIATLNQTRIVDDSGFLTLGGMVDPAALAARLARHGDARDFDQLADRFCAEIDFGQNW